MKEQDVARLVNGAIRDLFRDAVRITMKDPRQVFFMVQAIKNQRKAFNIRRRWERNGVLVPPFVIFSITNRCNLQCKGCYARLHHQAEDGAQEITPDKLSNILKEIRELGISIVLLAGGEPLVRPEILNLTRNFPEIIFPLFTNGLLINEEISLNLKKQPNLVPIISIEGNCLETDERRGSGVFETILQRMALLHSEGIFYGVSITVTQKNYPLVTAEQFVKQLIASGCKLFFFVEYVPVQEGTEDLVLDEQQRQSMGELMESFRVKHPGLFIAFPGDEAKFGGCLAAGRGFIHINARGGIEPCPFAPFSDATLTNLSLKEGLQSNLLKAIRENLDQLHEANGGCTLWENQDLVRALMAENQKKSNN